MSDQFLPQQFDEDHFHPELREDFTLAAHDLADHDQFGHADEGHNHDGSYADPIVKERSHVGTTIALDGTETTTHTVDIDIPTDWNGYDLEAWVGWAYDNDGTTPSSDRLLFVRLYVGGTQVREIDDIVFAATTRKSNSFPWHREGQTTTGIVTVHVTIQLGTDDSYVAQDRSLIVHATKTS